MDKKEALTHSEAPEANVGSRLRQLRRAQGYSLRSLAELSGLNINTLSLVEKGKTSPSVSTLQRLAQALAVPLIAFFEQDEEKKNISFLEKSDRKSTFINGTWLTSLTREQSCLELQPFILTIEPGTDSGSTPIVHTGCEFIYCLSGKVTYVVEGTPYLLEEGDSLIFESHLGHAWGNSQAEPAQLMLVMSTSEVRDNPGKRHFETPKISP